MIRDIENSDYIKFIKLLNLNISKDVFNLFINNLNKNRHIIIVYEKNDELIGTGSLLIEPKLTYNISYMGHIENVFVNENNRNKGIGKEIVKFLTNYAKKFGCYRIDLSCEEKIINFYKELGFNNNLSCMSMLIKENFK